MTTAIPVPSQAQKTQTTDTPAVTPQAEPYPVRLAGRLLLQFEEDLSSGDNQRARLVNTALLELQRMMTSAHSRQLDLQIERAWRRAVGCCF